MHGANMKIFKLEYLRVFQKCFTFQIQKLIECEDAGVPGYDAAFVGERFPTFGTTLLYSFARIKLTRKYCRNWLQIHNSLHPVLQMVLRPLDT
jgi:hypothetical protein